MPFKSEQQRKWMYANKPEMAKKWEKHTPKDKKLPKEAKKDKKDKKDKEEKSACISPGIKIANTQPNDGYVSKNQLRKLRSMADDNIAAYRYPEATRMRRIRNSPYPYLLPEDFT